MTGPMRERCDCYLGLGANTGDRAENLRAALRRIPPAVEICRVSSLYETAPIGVTDQPQFLNAVCEARTLLTPLALLAHLKGIEFELGRRPGRVWGPRPIDLDILLLGTQVVESPELQIPHARLGERSFVLIPLAELAPDLLVPGLNQTVASLRLRAGDAGVTRLAGAGWEA